jgi:hypothetical protein
MELRNSKQSFHMHQSNRLQGIFFVIRVGLSIREDVHFYRRPCVSINTQGPILMTNVTPEWQTIRPMMNVITPFHRLRGLLLSRSSSARPAVTAPTSSVNSLKTKISPRVLETLFLAGYRMRPNSDSFLAK